MFLINCQHKTVTRNLALKNTGRCLFSLHALISFRLYCFIFPQAFDLGMYGPDYVWILSGYIRSSWQASRRGVHCSSQELLVASEGYFKFGFSMHGLSQDIGRCGKVEVNVKFKNKIVVILL